MPDALQQDSLARFPAYLISPGYVCQELREDWLRPLRDPRSLELTLDSNFCAERREGRSLLAGRYWQLVHELPARFAELAGAQFDRAAWEQALAQQDDLPFTFAEEQPPFSLPFTRQGECVGELLTISTADWGLGDYYDDRDTLCLRYGAGDEQAAWQLIRGIIRDYGIAYHPLSAVAPWRPSWWQR